VAGLAGSDVGRGGDRGGYGVGGVARASRADLVSRWPLRALAYVASGLPSGIFTLIWLPVSAVLGLVVGTPLAIWPLSALERRGWPCSGRAAA
jgi:hypothetical protein